MQMKLTSCPLEGQWLWTQFPCTQNVSYYLHEPFIWNSKKKKKRPSLKTDLNSFPRSIFCYIRLLKFQLNII